MAQKVTVTVTCDMNDNKGAETVPFGFDGREYEIDLCSEHAAGLRKTLEESAAHARRLPRSAAPPPPPRRMADRRLSAEIRQWAAGRHAATGDVRYVVAARGRIPIVLADEFAQEKKNRARG